VGITRGHVYGDSGFAGDRKIPPNFALSRRFGGKILIGSSSLSFRSFFVGGTLKKSVGNRKILYGGSAVEERVDTSERLEREKVGKRVLKRSLTNRMIDTMGDQQLA